ncbi:heme peroxidase [Antrihabitans cavernicola]|uniref:heme peroxidase n=1 Tax=Antrihabitans cavernicola TaxID=2495913 RepID=UPI0016592DC3|nr:heme peroxidase [Spelaeibacter cavernicola]
MASVLETTSALAPTIAQRCAADLGDPIEWIKPEHYRDSLALCVIDSIQSTRSHYTSVKNVLARYSDFRSDQGADATHDGVVDLLRSFDRIGGPDAWADGIGNRKPTSTNAGAPLKSAAIQQVARILLDAEIEHAADLRSTDTLAAIEAAWTATPGQRSGLTWSYLLMLTGAAVPGHDRLVARYLARALDVAPKELQPDDADALLDGVAGQCGFARIEFEYALWRFESGRQVVRDPVAAPDKSQSPSSSPSVSR